MILRYLFLKLDLQDALLGGLLLLRKFCFKVFERLIKIGSISLEPTDCQSMPSHLVFSLSLLRYRTYNMVGIDTPITDLDSTILALVGLFTGVKDLFVR